MDLHALLNSVISNDLETQDHFAKSLKITQDLSDLE